MTTKDDPGGRAITHAKARLRAAFERENAQMHLKMERALEAKKEY